MRAKQPLHSISLDAKDLVILGVAFLEAELPEDKAIPIPYEYLGEKNKLILSLPRTIAPGETFRIRTETRCTPSDHILEGIYRDVTPPGAPQQYMSQCQQWGFQRIMPILDDCRAKCFVTTTIEADARYTHLISNGNVDRGLCPDGKPILKPGDPSRKIVRYCGTIPMAPYLFLVAVGTWDELVDEVRLDNGRRVRLEYLVPPGRKEHARIPMDILKRAVMWIHRTQNYEYPGETYRTICMGKSNFGGMENTGNTTIVTDAALIDEHTLNHALLYAHGVIVHEFEHNQCGSETTMETPFDIWLNEAYTVHVERQFLAEVFDSTFIRLTQVDSIRNPLTGPLAVEDGGHQGRIVREGFNDPDELIDGVTYVKAAEVIRMLQLIVGPDAFRSGKDLYFHRYKNSNANSDQFFQCFEEVSGQSLDQFKRTWLYTIGYPQVRATTSYELEKHRYRITFRQDVPSGLEPFHLPIELALVDHNGQTIPGTDRVFQLNDTTGELVFERVLEPPAFPSLNRDYAFYGTFCHENATREQMMLQARRDPNAFNRVEAMRQVTDHIRVRLLTDPDSEIDEDWLSLYGELLSDNNLSSALKAYLIRVDEQPLDRRFTGWFLELVTARERILRAVNRSYRGRLLALFEGIDTYRPLTSPTDGIEDRILKYVLLEIITVDDTRESQRVALELYRRATNHSDRVAALLALNRSSAEEAPELLEKTYQAWHRHISGYANYLRIVAGGTRPDVFDAIEREKKRATFDITQPTWVRALVLTMAMNTKMVWTDQGIEWVAAHVIQLASINPFIAGRLLQTFQHLKKLRPHQQAAVAQALERIIEGVPESACPSVHRQARSYLAANSPT